jgi:hypothetical protein
MLPSNSKNSIKWLAYDESMFVIMRIKTKTSSPVMPAATLAFLLLPPVDRINLENTHTLALIATNRAMIQLAI